MKISEIDSNFDIQTSQNYSGIKFFDAELYPFKIYGLMKENDAFCRMPKSVAESVSNGVAELYMHTAGGRVRFASDSKEIAIKAQMGNICKFPHFTLAGSAGFDIYIKKDGKDIYYKTFMPPYDIKDGYESKVSFEKEEMREITINFPLYSGIKKLFIGLNENSNIQDADDYTIEKPVVFYGSSITQGGCASRPGNSYEAIFSRELNCNYINLGFSGSAKGEEEIAEYIKGLDMSAFVYDYDHNAPNVEHLKCTHKRMFDAVRKAQPSLPIVILSMPTAHMNEEKTLRMNVIKETYDCAIDSGDKNVYFISGEELIGKEFSESWSVDDCHPNDCGFVSMAKKLIDLFKKNIFKENKTI